MKRVGGNGVLEIVPLSEVADFAPGKTVAFKLVGTVYTLERIGYRAVYVIWFLPPPYGMAFVIDVPDDVPGSPARQWVMDILPDLITYVGPATMRAYVTPSPAQLMPPAPEETAGANSTPTG